MCRTVDHGSFKVFTPDVGEIDFAGICSKCGYELSIKKNSNILRCFNCDDIIYVQKLVWTNEPSTSSS